MPFLTDLDTANLERAEQAAAFLNSLSAYFWRPDNRLAIADLLAEMREELASRKTKLEEAS